MILYSSIEKLHFPFLPLVDFSTYEYFARNELQRTWETGLFDIPIMFT